MYNLLVTSKANAWNGPPATLAAERCIKASEFSDPTLASSFENLDSTAFAQLLELPCIFAYEGDRYRTPGDAPPRFGFIVKVSNAQERQTAMLRIHYELREIPNFLSSQQLFTYADELGIDLDCFEMTRTHWAVKDINLQAILRTLGIVIPSSRRPAVDIRTHTFDVALSFPGEARTTVEAVATALAEMIGKDAVFYDNHFQAQLAKPNLDLLLQDIYRNRSKLVVVFLSSDYQNKEWCGVEFRAIREIIQSREDKVMFVRTDGGAVDGVFKTDGYIDARIHDASTIAKFIYERVELNQGST